MLYCIYRVSLAAGTQHHCAAFHRGCLRIWLLAHELRLPAMEGGNAHHRNEKSAGAIYVGSLFAYGPSGNKNRDREPRAPQI